MDSLASKENKDAIKASKTPRALVIIIEDEVQIWVFYVSMEWSITVL